MRLLYTLLLATGSLLSLSAQRIPFDTTVIDLNTRPDARLQLRESLDFGDDTYLLLHNFATDLILPTELHRFDGRELTPVRTQLLAEDWFRVEPDYNALLGTDSTGFYLALEDELIGGAGSAPYLAHYAPATDRLDTIAGPFGSMQRATVINGVALAIVADGETLDDPDRLIAVTPDGRQTVLATADRDAFYNVIDILEDQPDSNRIFFRVVDRLWSTDGTAAGTVAYGNDVRNGPVRVGGRLIYQNDTHLVAYDSLSAREVDLTAAYPGFVLYRNVTSGDGWVRVGNRLLFMAESDVTGIEVFITDGTPAGTGPLVELGPGAADGAGGGVFELNDGRVWFVGGGANAQNVYVSDGTPAGTKVIFDGLLGTEIMRGSTGVAYADGTVGLFLTEETDNFFEPRNRVVRSTPTGADYAAEILYDYTGRLTDKGPLTGDRWTVQSGGNGNEPTYAVIPASGNPLPFQYPAGSGAGLDALFASGNYVYTITSSDTILYQLDVRTAQLEPVVNLDLRTSLDGLEIFQRRDTTYTLTYNDLNVRDEYVLSTHAFAPSGAVTTLPQLNEYTQGITVSEGIRLGGYLVFTQSDFSRFPFTYRILSVDARGRVTELLSATTDISLEETVLGTSGPWRYVRLANRRYYRFHIGENRLEPVTLPDQPTDGLTLEGQPGRALFVNDTVYRARILSNLSDDRLYELSATTLGGTDWEVLVTDFYTAEANPFRYDLNLFIDSHRVYYALPRGATQAAARYYDVRTAATGGLGAPLVLDRGAFREADGELFFVGRNQLNGNDIASVDNYGTTGTTVTLTGTINSLHRVRTGYVLTTNLGEIFGTTFTATSPLEITNQAGIGNAFIRGVAKVPGSEEVLFVYEPTRGDITELYRTDGTEGGTRLFGTILAEDLDTPLASNPDLRADQIGDYLILHGALANQLILVDTMAGSTTIIPGQVLFVEFNVAPTVLDDRYLVQAIHPQSGREFHLLSFGAQGPRLTGLAYEDTNGNGTREPGEPGLPGIRISGGRGNLAFSTSDGSFGLPVRAGNTYTVTATAPNCYVATGTERYDLTFAADSTYAIEFGFRPRTGPAELTQTLATAFARCRFTIPVWYTLTNSGCSDLTAATVQIYAPTGGRYVDGGNPVAITDDYAEFELAAIPGGRTRDLRLSMTMPNEDFTGQDITLRGIVVATTADGTTLRDTFDYVQSLRCAIDPNDKQVFPRRAEPTMSNYTQLDETLNYLIRFQNTGNDTAFTVRIEDQLSADLDWETFKPLAASHPYTATVSENGLATFLFEDILLPDSTTDYVGSNGFVRFEIRALPTLEDFDVIENTAGIFFDFNRPVITNTVRSTFVEDLDVDDDGALFYEDCVDTDPNISPFLPEIEGNDVDENCDGFLTSTRGPERLAGRLTVAPNPTRDGVQLTYDLDRELRVELLDARGQLLRTVNVRRSGVVDLSVFPAGAYVLRVRDLRDGGTAVRWVVRQ